MLGILHPFFDTNYSFEIKKEIFQANIDKYVKFDDKDSDTFFFRGKYIGKDIEINSFFHISRYLYPYLLCSFFSNDNTVSGQIQYKCANRSILIYLFSGILTGAITLQLRYKDFTETIILTLILLLPIFSIQLLYLTFKKKELLNDFYYFILERKVFC